jgi:hypothetical protein
MDARIFFYLSDSITTASDAAELEVIGDLVRATAMDAFERRALERVLREREATLRNGNAALPRPPAALRGD